MGKAQEKLNKIPIIQNPDYLKQKQGILRSLEQFIYQHKHALVFIHALMFFLFLALVMGPLFLPAPMESATIVNNFTLCSQFLLWGIWFPLVFVSVLFSGRSWCGVLCPMGAASEWLNKVGLKRPIPGWLKWEGTPILSFIFVTILGQTIDVRDEATAIAELFGGTLLLALLIGFFYGRKKRAWCRHVCPIGLLLGVFSRLGAVQFATKQVRKGQDQYTEKGICPTMIAINHKHESRHCIQCFRCIKPQSEGGLFIKLRKWGEEIIQIRHHNPNLAEIAFIFLGTGIALGGFLWLILPEYTLWREQIGTWFINHGWYWIGYSGPSWLMSVHPEARQTYNWLDFMMIVGFMLGCMIIVSMVLSLCTALSAYFAGVFHARGSFKERFIELGYQFTPVAMLSIIISLGDKLFSELHLWGMSPTLLSITKGSLLLLSMLWSISLSRKLLLELGVTRLGNLISLIPGSLGTLFIGISWWPAIFGIHSSLLEQYRQHLMILH